MLPKPQVIAEAVDDRIVVEAGLAGRFSYHPDLTTKPAPARLDATLKFFWGG